MWSGLPIILRNYFTAKTTAQREIEITLRKWRHTASWYEKAHVPNFKCSNFAQRRWNRRMMECRRTCLLSRNPGWAPEEKFWILVKRWKQVMSNGGERQGSTSNEYKLLRRPGKGVCLIICKHLSSRCFVKKTSLTFWGHPLDFYKRAFVQMAECLKSSIPVAFPMHFSQLNFSRQFIADRWFKMSHSVVFL